MTLKMKNNKYLNWLISAGCVLALAACSANDPISDLSLEETQVYMTDRDKTVNFKDYKTFSVVDSVLIYGNQGTGTALTEVDVMLLNRIVQNMEKHGYQYVAASQKPDVGINVAQVNNSYVNVVSQPVGSYWGSYWGGWGMGYPSYYSYYTVNESYWMLEMLDFKNANVVDKELNVVWRSQIRGEGINDKTLVQGMVDKIFDQSEYLNIK
jgi:hypothetical protein